MDAVGKDLLAHAALADDEDVGLARRDLLDQVKEVAHLDVLENRLELRLGPLHAFLQAFGFLAQLDRFLPETAMLQRLGHEAEQLIRHVGLADKMEGPFLDGGDGVVQRIVRGHDNNWQSGMRLADLPQQIQPFTVGQAQIEQQNVRFVLIDHLQALFPREGRRRAIAAPFQYRG